MRRIFGLAFALSLSLFAAPASAQSHGVGLGAAAGLAIPASGDVDYKVAFNWGFFVDIPLISTFHITPSTLVYKLDPKETGLLAGASAHVTDVSLNFKFMIPLGIVEPFAGVTGGLTAGLGELYPHAGVLAGLSFNLIANLDVFAQVNYKLVIIDQNNIRDLQVYVGPLFRFR